MSSPIVIKDYRIGQNRRLDTYATQFEGPITFSHNWQPSLAIHTSAKLNEIPKIGHPKRHGLRESSGQVESNDAPHGSWGLLK